MQRMKRELFKQRRDELGLTLRAVEEKTGVNRGTINKLEKGTHDPSALNMLRLMHFYRIEVIDIVLAK